MRAGMQLRSPGPHLLSVTSIFIFYFLSFIFYLTCARIEGQRRSLYRAR